jgi:hypothetical protein
MGRLSTKRHVRRVVGKVSPSGGLLLGDGASFPDQKRRRSAFEAPGLIIQPNLRLSPDAIFRFFSQTCGSVDGNSWSRSLIPGSNAKRGGSSGGGRRS